ncbi:MAG: 3-phosphoserine/phosphohydroxythreonine transaminase [Gammaproteobacteria bacterium]|nr:3-phosphoserine/phosphohydroxythreonine transaminase [Gammaproteobacteria bacterium]MBT8105191.1 3-phosphoserine/phosphohydroxythreonine transaminase [Gammaproteobacteria bacterium]NNF50057.1 3-phosphoserine/phosphohydroxythreonine transaminase [Woeseiaceae bacterium]NNK25205.1 3-phosphoserine/phosphohydroxythreonine transaminase [Woeseiaceae bacterium]
MSRVYNFSPGPATLPLEVLETIRNDIPDWCGTGMSVMEVSHRGKDFTKVAAHAEATLRELMGVPDDYSVLFCQGGATLQMAMAPLNLAGPDDTVDYVLTGSWGKKAAGEAGKFCKVNIAADASDRNFTYIPDESAWARADDAAYLHITPNETIAGVEFHFVPGGDAPIVADMSSNILSRPIDVRDYGVIYAGAQKNIGPAGITLVIVRNDLLERVRPNTPHLLTWKSYADSDSMTNTPPTFTWYVADLVFQWLKDRGGVEAMAEVNQRKSSRLYAAIDASDFYSNPVAEDCRSRMNVPFILADDGLDATFLEESAAAGLVNLKGHRSVGGMRASIYNAMPEEGVDTLIAFMAEFERKYG